MAQLWLIERDVAGWSEAELRAATIRAKMGVRFYDSMEWVRSFYDESGGRTLCIYRAESEDDVRRHASNCGLPCGAVLPVEEILPQDIDEPTSTVGADSDRPPAQGGAYGNASRAGL